MSAESTVPAPVTEGTVISDKPPVVELVSVNLAAGGFSAIINLIGNLLKNGMFDMAAKIFKVISNPSAFSLQQVIDLVMEAIALWQAKAVVTPPGVGAAPLDVNSLFADPVAEDGKVSAFKPPTSTEVLAKLPGISPFLIQIVITLISRFGPTAWEWVINRFGSK
jgi:hypothetical protein